MRLGILVWVRIRTELEAAKETLSAEHVKYVTVLSQAGRLELPQSLPLLIVLSRPDLGNPVSQYFLEGQEMVGHVFDENRHLVPSLVPQRPYVHQYWRDASFSTVWIRLNANSLCQANDCHCQSSFHRSL